MTLTPTEDKDWEVLDWCFYSECQITDGCQKGCRLRHIEMEK